MQHLLQHSLYFCICLKVSIIKSLIKKKKTKKTSTLIFSVLFSHYNLCYCQFKFHSPHPMLPKQFLFPILAFHPHFFDLSSVDGNLYFSLNTSIYKISSFSQLRLLTEKQEFHSKTVHLQISEFMYSFNTFNGLGKI